MVCSNIRGTLRPLSVAPVMERTDRHFRVLMRGLTRQTLLYTEMITTRAILHGDRNRLLDFDPIEKPLALQLGGDDPDELAECAVIAEGWGYDEVNINVGCPSERVQKGSFGACLMRTPDLVARCVEAMRRRSKLPITVKHRIGVDELDRYEDMLNFVDLVAKSGSDRFSVHARKAWLKGLSPKENRTIPPLRYDEIYRLKRERPQLNIEINGGVVDLESAQQHLRQIDAVMIGRAAWDNPFVFEPADRNIFKQSAPLRGRAEVVQQFMPYIEKQLAIGTRPTGLLRNLLNLYSGQPGGRRFRRRLGELASNWNPNPGAHTELVRSCLQGLAHAVDEVENAAATRFAPEIPHIQRC